MNGPLRVVLVCVGSLLIGSCTERNDAPRKYQETTFFVPSERQKAQTATGLEEPALAAPDKGQGLSWKTPDGWQERSAGGMRLATFVVSDGQSECTIIAFPGDVGGLRANLSRWLGQLDLSLSEEDFSGFMASAASFQTAGGWEGSLFDFNELEPDRPDESMSMLVGIIQREGEQVFVKLMGEKGLLVTERTAFLSLCTSLQ